jgi:uncharacterized protein DUF6885
VTVIPGNEALAALHARALPQKHNLCGAFWGALALQAAGFDQVDGEPVDQDLVAIRAGTTLPEGDPASFAPRGASPRLDYRLPIPIERGSAASGTAVPALARAIEDLAGGALATVPIAGPWDGPSVLDLVEIAATAAPSALLIANIQSGRLWGSQPSPAALLDHLAGREVDPDPPPPEWDVGHFVSLAATIRGPGGSLVVVRDTYPSLGWLGYHLQPPEALAAALVRGDGRRGGVLAVATPAEADTLAARLAEGRFTLGHWDNGTPEPGEED